MSRPNPEELGTVIEELANALQAALGLAAMVRRQMRTVADDAFAVDVAIARAVTALKRLQPPPSGPGGETR
jgi:hypothetical protein